MIAAALALAGCQTVSSDALRARSRPPYCAMVAEMPFALCESR